MNHLTIGTFNCENLFARYRFRAGLEPTANDGFGVNDLAFDIADLLDKKLTAAAVKAGGADVLCLQEVESMLVLDRFKSQFLGGVDYRHRLVIDGNDPRHIDLGVLSKLPMARIRTWRHERNQAGTADLFSRDLLEVDVEVDAGEGGSKVFTLFVNHLKSMIGGRGATHERRLEQAQRVVEILDERFGPDYDANFAVVGDLNDYLDRETSLAPFVDHPELVNVNEALADEDRWTHFWAGGNEYRQLDYVWLSRGLWERAGKPAPIIVRDGLPHRATRYEGQRFEDVGDNVPKASDHCPVLLSIPVNALV
jgi:endonuclease/exonuclease/phosphatase family metal-dependent hydrolase